MMQLPEGCYCSDPIISPLNCNTTDVDWQVQCRFHDPLFKDEFPKGYQVVKKGMNKFKDLKKRQEASEIIKNALIEKLRDRGFNPITGRYMLEIKKMDYEIDPDTPMLDALNASLGRIIERNKKLETKKNVKKNMKRTLWITSNVH